MGNYIKKAAAHARLVKLASVARLIRRQRAMEKYAQAVYMQKLAAKGEDAGAGSTGGAATAKYSPGKRTGLAALIGAGVGGLGGLAFGPEDKKLLSTLIGAGTGAGVGAGGYQLAHHAFKDGGWNDQFWDWWNTPKAKTPAPAPAAAPAAAPADSE